MPRKAKPKVFHLNAILDGHLVAGRVAFSPPPEPGIMTEIARFEAERMIAALVEDTIDSASR